MTYLCSNGRRIAVYVAKSARFNELRNLYFVGWKLLSPGLVRHVTMAWWVYRPLLNMLCVGSIASMIYLFLCEKSSKVLDLSIVRAEGRALEFMLRCQ